MKKEAFVFAEGLVEQETLLARIDALRVNEAIKNQIRERVIRDFEKLAPT